MVTCLTILFTMKNKKLYQYIISYILFILFFIFYGTLCFAGKKVIAKGFSFYEPGRELIAREKALDQAKRAAIEQVAGTYLDSISLVENARLVQDQIFSRSRGYLKNLKILKEKKTKLGTYEITIEAEVELNSLKNDIKHFQDILRLQNNPRVFIQINPSVPSDCIQAILKIKAYLADRLQQAGFILLASPAKSNSPSPELIIDLSGEISTTSTQYKDIFITLNELSCTASIIRPCENRILATASATASIPGENRLQVMEQGTQMCVSKIWKTLRQKLLSVWKLELYGLRKITLVIHRLHNYNEARHICGIMENEITGIQSVQLLKFRHKTGIYVVKYKGWPKFLLSEMSMSYFQHKCFSFLVEQIENNKMVIRLNKIVAKREN